MALPTLAGMHHLPQVPSVVVRIGKIRDSVVRFAPGPGPEHTVMESIEHAAVPNEQEQFLWMRAHPLGDHRRNALENLLKGIGIRRQDGARRLVCPQAVLRLHVLDHEPTEAAEIPFYEAAFDMDRLLYLLANYRGRCERADQRARNNPGDRSASKASRSSTRLSDAGRVQGNVRVPLIASFEVPIRLAVAQEVEGALRNHSK